MLPIRLACFGIRSLVGRSHQRIAVGPAIAQVCILRFNLMTTPHQPAVMMINVYYKLELQRLFI